MSPQLVIYVLWLLWTASWIAAAFWSEPTEKRAPWKENAAQRLLVLAGVVLLFAHPSRRLPVLRALWRLPYSFGWLMAALVLAGLLFCWWARIHLGQFWSSDVGRKRNHRVVDTGPYAVVRHPIYTGIILASFATAATQGTATAPAGAAIMTLGWYVKARFEEQFLRRELGPAYDRYGARVAMLVPFVRL
jgi:protein-S-isoprenylcysteine O-methyltransferase Ste14